MAIDWDLIYELKKLSEYIETLNKNVATLIEQNKKKEENNG